MGFTKGDAEVAIDKYTNDESNHREQRLLHFLSQDNIYMRNSFLSEKNQRKWTWIRPNGSVKNELVIFYHNEQEIYNQRHESAYEIFDINHGLIQAKVQLNVKMEKTLRLLLLRD